MRHFLTLVRASVLIGVTVFGLMACGRGGDSVVVTTDGAVATSSLPHSGINAMSYSKVGYSGEALASSATIWCAVKDNVTGLLWQNHEGYPATFTNYGDNRAGDASEYAAANATLCGQSGWRLPTVDELQTIVDYSRISPSINTTWFLNTASAPYWSSSPYVGNSGYAWYVYFDYGYVNNYGGRSGNYPVRLVRASQ